MAGSINRRAIIVHEEGDCIVLKIPKRKCLEASKSGNSLIVATTEGELETELTVEVNGEPRNIKVNANFYVKRGE